MPTVYSCLGWKCPALKVMLITNLSVEGALQALSLSSITLLPLLVQSVTLYGEKEKVILLSRRSLLWADTAVSLMWLVLPEEGESQQSSESAPRGCGGSSTLTWAWLRRAGAQDKAGLPAGSQLWWTGDRKHSNGITGNKSA